MSIAETFSALRAQGKMAFMPFITAGDPDLEFTTDLIRELAARKVDLIEIGFPYSDPIADGPVIQASYNRSLGKKITVEKIFAAHTMNSRASLAASKHSLKLKANATMKKQVRLKAEQ